MFSAHEGEKASSFNGYFCALDNLDKPFMDAGMQRQLLEESEKQLNTVSPSEKFVGKVIYSPDCFNELLQMALENFASSGVLIDGTSPWKDALNTKVASEKLSLRSVPLDGRTVVGQRFTSDGYPAENMDIIVDGVLKTFILSQYGANKTGFPRALNGGNNLEVLPGDKTLEEMISGIDRGLDSQPLLRRSAIVKRRFFRRREEQFSYRKRKSQQCSQRDNDKRQHYQYAQQHRRDIQRADYGRTFIHAVG